MKRFLPITLLTLALTASGCAWVGRQMPWHHDSTAAAAKPDSTKAAAKPEKEKVHAAKTKEIVTADESLVAKVLSVNSVGRFVVLDFPEGRMPKLDLHLFLYRNGLKAAEVKVVGPRQDTCIVADLLSGDAQPGDVVHEQ
jgi:hypothetical protein